MAALKFFVFSIILLNMYNVFCQETNNLFSEFISIYKKNYTSGSLEYQRRHQFFQKNLAVQKRLNSSRKSNVSAWYGPTQFSDLTEEEFTEKYLSSYKVSTKKTPPVPVKNQYLLPLPLTKIPNKVDWRNKHIVTPVKNQGSCGGCWAFSSVAVVESMYAKKSGILESLSVQEVIDCSYSYSKILAGCKGGDTCTALKWLRDNAVNLVSEKKYPTKDKPEECKLNPVKTPGVHIKNFTCYSYVKHEDQLLQVLANTGPVSVSVDATNWNNYQGGIVQYHCGDKPNNHAVAIVGYDLSGEVPYYIVKNSWGDQFGIEGYIYVMIGNNVCGIAQEVAEVEM